MVQILNTQDGTINLISNEEYIVRQGSLITASGNTFAFAGESSIILLIEGTIFAGGGDGTQDNALAIGNKVVVGATGSLTGWSDGIELSGTDALVRNLGSIVGLGDSGVELTGTGGYLSNSGTIEGVGHGVQTAGEKFIANSGLITGERGVDMRGGDAQLINTGTIESAGRFASSGTESAGVYFYGGDGYVIRNTGVISGVEYAIKAPELSANDALIFNSGTLDGEVNLDAGVHVLANSGSIMGDVLLGGGADTYRAVGQGLATGQIRGEEGNDTLVGGEFADDFDGGDQSDLLLGRGGDDVIAAGFGNDTVLGGDGDDSVTGEGGSDRINGGEGNDTLSGGSENDTVAGQGGDDLIEGGGGTDVLDGGDGIDTLLGGSGNDLIRGRDGVDFLTGEQGLDVLTGGEGADVFVYNALSESTANANRDVITDFEKGVDDINLVNVIPGVFAFRGTAGFTATGGPELRLQETAAGSTIVRMDADGNGTTDMEINVAQVQGLTADDFVL